jgi:predicted nucleic acid-binding protein
VATTENPPWVVADAGPIIHLDELAALDVMGDYPKILVPGSVWDEIAHHRPQALSQPGVRLVKTEAPPASPMVTSLTSLYCLHRGECDALSLCLHLNVSSLLSDDTAARLAATSLGIKTHGTLGLLIRAARRQLRSPQEILDLLLAIPQQSILHLRPSLLEDIIQQLRGEWQI